MEVISDEKQLLANKLLREAREAISQSVAELNILSQSRISILIGLSSGFIAGIIVFLTQGNTSIIEGLRGWSVLSILTLAFSIFFGLKQFDVDQSFFTKNLNHFRNRTELLESYLLTKDEAFISILRKKLDEEEIELGSSLYFVNLQVTSFEIGALLFLMPLLDRMI